MTKEQAAVDAFIRELETNYERAASNAAYHRNLCMEYEKQLAQASANTGVWMFTALFFAVAAVGFAIRWWYSLC